MEILKILYDFIIAWNISDNDKNYCKNCNTAIDNRISKSYMKNIDDKDDADDNSINDVTEDDTARKNDD